MKKDLRDRDALRASVELAPFGRHLAFDAVDVVDLRKLAELIRDHAAGSLDAVTIETAAAFGGTSKYRFQCVQRALRALVGEDHPATVAVVAANRGRGHKHRRSREGARHRDSRSREAILHGPDWAKARALPGAMTMPLQELRAVDRYFAFCAEHGRLTGEVDTFLDFVKGKDSSMLLRTVRDGLETLLTAVHPTVLAAEKARSAKEGDYYRRRKPADARAAPARPLEVSVPFEELPDDWRAVLDMLRAGRQVHGCEAVKEKTVVGMTTAARQLVWAARRAGLPDEISLQTIRAYDRALDEREAQTQDGVLETCKVRASSRAILFGALRMFGRRLGIDEGLSSNLKGLVAHYERQAEGDVKLKESRLADLPDLGKIFDHANALLDEAAEVTDRRSKVTLYVDAAALAFLSIIALRNQDTVLVWGRDIQWIGDDNPEDWGLGERKEALGYYLDLQTSKTDAALAGPLAPILTPFLDALILRGQDERLLPKLRESIMKAPAPVFPTTNGKPRSVRNLSNRWRVHLGTGSIISRTRIHTLLGALGEHGTRAALALCAQRSPRTAKWYQAEALGRRRMLESQEMIAGLIKPTAEDEAMLAELVAVGVGAPSEASPEFPRAGKMDKDIHL